MKIDEVKRNAFYKIPKWLFDEEYQGLSLRAKIAYILIFDRVSLSVKNNWHDKDGNVFVYYPNEELMSMLHCSRQTLVDTKKELSAYGLIHEVRQGVNLPNRLYIFGSLETRRQEVQELDVKKSKNQTSRSLETRRQEVQKLDTTKTDNIKTDNTKTEFINTDVVVVNNKAEILPLEVMKALKDNNINNNKINNKKLCNYLTVDKMGKDMLVFAIEQTGEIEKPSFRYLRAILEDWKEKGFTSLEQVKLHERYRQEERSYGWFNSNKELTTQQIALGEALDSWLKDS